MPFAIVYAVTPVLLLKQKVKKFFFDIKASVSTEMASGCFGQLLFLGKKLTDSNSQSLT